MPCVTLPLTPKTKHNKTHSSATSVSAIVTCQTREGRTVLLWRLYCWGLPQCTGPASYPSSRGRLPELRSLRRDATSPLSKPCFLQAQASSGTCGGQWPRGEARRHPLGSCYASLTLQGSQLLPAHWQFSLPHEVAQWQAEHLFSTPKTPSLSPRTGWQGDHTKMSCKSFLEAAEHPLHSHLKLYSCSRAQRQWGGIDSWKFLSCLDSLTDLQCQNG